MLNKLSPLPKFLIDRYKNWKLDIYKENKDNFNKLAKFGQQPNSMVISCCDSRIHVTSIFGADEGEFFIHRNIANLVPPYAPDSEHHGTSAAIEFAIKELRVQHLIILGHRDCGGIKSGHSLHSRNSIKNYEFINNWLEILFSSFNNISKNISQEKQIEQLEEEGIKTSLSNLFTFPFVKKAVEDKKLSVHGLIHNIKSGELKFLNPSSKKFENL